MRGVKGIIHQPVEPSSRTHLALRQYIELEDSNLLKSMASMLMNLRKGLKMELFFLNLLSCYLFTCFNSGRGNSHLHCLNTKSPALACQYAWAVGGIVQNSKGQ
jgi:hypothetical protein